MKSLKELSAPIRLALISLVIVGIIFPILMTGIGQVAFPYQANGSQQYYDGRSIGSGLIAQNFTAAVFFHARNGSGVDPDITMSDALSQIPRIHNATGIPLENLTAILLKFRQFTMFFFGTAYVNVLDVNLYLVDHYPSIYSKYVV